MFDDDTYLKTYQNLLFSESENLQNISNNSKRNCMTLTYLTATNTLDNDTTCKILETDINNYLLNDTKMKEFENRMKAKLVKTKFVPEPLKGNLKCSNIYVKDECFKEGFCRNSETIDKDEFRNFLQTIFSKKKESTDQKNSLQRCEMLEEKENFKPKTSFKTVAELMGKTKNISTSNNSNTTHAKRTLGVKRSISNKFISPIISRTNSGEQLKEQTENEVDERLKNIEPKMVELILSEIMDTNPTLTWDDIAGLEFAKNAIQEAVVWPLLRPDLFTGLRQPPKGILLFGPPGTGKTLIGKCVAAQSKSTFFSISASSLTSKWIGDGEKMVRALFSVARCHPPAVVFIDEIDSLLSQRSETEHECSRRMKTEFLVQLDGANTDSDERLLIIGATNRPQELDEAARRRFVKRLYVPLPENNARFQLVQRLMSKEKHSLTRESIQEIADLTEGYSGADMKTLCAEASMGPIRSLDIKMIENIQAAEVRPISKNDFTNALIRVKSSVSNKDLDAYVTWNNTFGSGVGIL